MTTGKVPEKCPYCLSELSKIVTEHGKPVFHVQVTYICKRCMRSFTPEELERLWEEKKRQEGQA